MVSRSSLTSNHDDSGDKLACSLRLRSVKDGQISVDDIEDIHQLPLILVDTLDLNIVQSIERDVVTSVRLDPPLEPCLVLSLDLDESIHEVFVSCIGSQLLQVVERRDPLVDATEGVTDQVGELWITAVDPSSWSDTVGLVLEFTRVQLVELFEDSLLQEL